LENNDGSNYKDNKSEINVFENKFSLNSEELTLIIKKYNRSNAFSNFIHHNLNRNYIIRGNFVRNFNLNL